MAILPILIAPDKRLKTKAPPVSEIDDEVRRLMDDMLETMYAAPGIGLAATQVGVLQRVIVIDLADPEENEPPAPMRIANPEIVWRSETLKVYNEGCLSIPEIYADIERPEAVEVSYLDETGERRTVKADGMLATCLQHEIDHLDGVLFTDYLTALKRNMIMRKLEKQKKAGEFD
jgi:peptide deformylase